MANCPVCDAEIELDDDVILGEVIECFECGSDLEIVSITPYALEEAPETDEDWGE